MLSRAVPHRRQSEGNRTEKMLCRSTRKGARTVARWGPRRSRRVRVSVSQLLKTTSNSSMRHATARRWKPVTGAGGTGKKRWLTLVRSRSTVTDQYMCPGKRVQCRMRYPAADSSTIYDGEVELRGCTGRIAACQVESRASGDICFSRPAGWSRNGCGGMKSAEGRCYSKNPAPEGCGVA